MRVRESLYDQGEEAYVSGDYVRALELFMEEWELGRTSDCLNYIGCCCLAVGDYAAAEFYFRRLAQMSPDSEGALFYMGFYYYELQDYAQARRYYKQSIRLNGEQAESHLNLGMCYFKMTDGFGSVRAGSQDGAGGN